ncbi:MAG: phosphoribosylglycinamide formyltransferase [Ignavibacteria bacterium]|nr:phosphoribosylglycinamide formyltransferase [Ignavibacteria bacterium]
MSNETASSGLKIAVFGSGRGSNFGAIDKAIREGILPHATIVLVVSNNASAGILERAKKGQIPVLHISAVQFDSEEKYVGSLLEELQRHQVNFIALAGYMKRLPSGLITKYRNRIVNIHPALLPKFGGKGMYGEHVHRAVLESGDKQSGATVHVVDEEYDTGPVVLQKEVPVLPSDTVETLAARVLEIEHLIYPAAIRLFAEGRISFREQGVVVHHQ